jgi:hypothetical protein
LTTVELGDIDMLWIFAGAGNAVFADPLVIAVRRPQCQLARVSATELQQAQ